MLVLSLLSSVLSWFLWDGNSVRSQSSMNEYKPHLSGPPSSGSWRTVQEFIVFRRLVSICQHFNKCKHLSDLENEVWQRMVWHSLRCCSDLLVLPVSKLGGQYKYLAGNMNITSVSKSMYALLHYTIWISKVRVFIKLGFVMSYQKFRWYAWFCQMAFFLCELENGILIIFLLQNCIRDSTNSVNIQHTHSWLLASCY